MDDINISLSDATQAGLRLAVAILAELERRGADLESMTPDALAEHSRQLNAANRSMSTLLKEARSLAEDGVRALARLSAEEKREVVLDWAASLPAEQYRLLLQELTRIYNQGRREQG